MSKHTPGPWYWDSDPIKGDPSDRVRYRVVATGKTITQCYYSSGDAQSEWDARLIAAAPELLECLSIAVEVLKNVTPSGDQDSDDILRDTITEARAAIAKATGEQP